jgi:hypothetical protein
VNLRDLAGRIDRLQKSFRFKLIATILVVLAASISYSIWLAASVGEGTATQVVGAEESIDGADAPSAEDISGGPALTADALRARIRSSSAWIAVGVATLALTVVSTIVIWLGLALTYVGLILVAIFAAGPLYFFKPTQAFGQMLFGAIALTASFSVLVQALRAALSGDRPIIAIARNVLDEALRMKIGLIFIVALIFLLAALPELLDEAQPLRYRVQSFLQYSVTATFWVLALLTLFFSVATVAFEQRDRLIWQTMVKPVSPLSYLLGKWLGVMTLNLALLSVSATGVFLFVEYLRNQPAQGEIKPFLMVDGRAGITQDRQILESQVLTARAGASVDSAEINMDRLNDAVEERIREATQRDFTLREDATRLANLRDEIQEELLTQAIRQYMAVPPSLNTPRDYQFSGLGSARDLERPLTVRYKVNAGSNDPGVLYRLVFVTPTGLVKQQTPLGIMQTFQIPPFAIDENGNVGIRVYNGDPEFGVTNPLTISFPPDGLEILYTASTYEANFFRISATLWMKLGFIAAVGVSSATFLSFPVACLLTLLVLFAAESSVYLEASLEEYPIKDTQGNIQWLALIMTIIATPVSAAFQTYGELRPTANLVDGRLVAWSTLAKGFLTLAAWSAAALGIGWSIFRKRELAIYSGH